MSMQDIRSYKLYSILQEQQMPPAANTGGDCYEAAVNFVMAECSFGDADDCDFTIVHGEVAGQGPLEGYTFGHAWVLKDGMVIDRSNGRDVQMPKKLYYALGQIDRINNVWEYPWRQARNMILNYEHYGPWDLETSSGY